MTIDKTVVLCVPAMACRHDLRVISAQIGDVTGVVAVQVDLEARTVQVVGNAQIDELYAAIAVAGYEVARC